VVTGASGFIGQALVSYLLEGGCEVFAVDRNPLPKSFLKSEVIDVSAPTSIYHLLDSETTIFHLAASANVAGSVENPRWDFENTFRGLFEVLEAARKYNCRVVFPSTASIYDPANTLPLLERAFPRPTSPYAAGKLAGESYCYAYYRSYGLDVRVVRLFSVYGIGMRRFAIHDIIRKIQSNSREITILGDGNQIRDYLYIDDAVRGLVMIATQGGAGEDYNVASGKPITIVDLTKMIAELMGHPNICIKPTGKTFPGDTKQWFANIAKVRKIGFVPQITLQEGLRRTIAWLAANKT
jgi:nucleoside-diphosphate-sugar epimerase